MPSIYRPRRPRASPLWQIFDAGNFLAAAIQHIPPKYQQTVRYYGLYSNKTRGLARKGGEIVGHPGEGPGDPQGQLEIIPAPRHASARALRPLWRQLIERVWGVDPLICPCCKGSMRRVGTIERREEVEFFLRLHGLWEGVLDIPPPPAPPYDVETLEPLDLPPQWSWRNAPVPPSDRSDQPAAWSAPELALDDERILVFDAETSPEEWLAN